MDEKELENKNEQKETLDGVDVGEESVVTKHEIAMALYTLLSVSLSWHAGC